MPFAEALPRADHAGFWRRAAAHLIDGALYSAASYAISPIGALFISDDLAVQVVAAVVVVLLGWVYEAGMQSGPQQATIGKIALSISVTDLDGRRITFARATGRYYGSLLSYATVGVGFLMVAWTRRKQGLHDIVAGTLVVQRDALPADRRPARA